MSEPYATTTCLFTNTANQDFLVDGADGITLVSPCTGHGAKSAPWPRSCISGFSNHVLDPTDRFADGFTVGDLWA